jgi:hypothetical protein
VSELWRALALLLRPPRRPRGVSGRDPRTTWERGVDSWLIATRLPFGAGIFPAICYVLEIAGRSTALS